MSKVVKVREDRPTAHIVQTDDGNYYYVDSIDLCYGEYETMVFEADSSGEVTNWSGEYCERYNDFIDMISRHNYIINHLEEVL